MIHEGCYCGARSMRFLRQRFRFLVPLWLLAALIHASPLSAKDFFEIQEFANQGRSVAARIADLDGDGRMDLFVVAMNGIPPEENRFIRVYLQRLDGSLPEEPNHTIALPRWSAVYDVADVRPENPGEELILLRPEGVTLMGLGSPAAKRFDLNAPGPTTAGVSEDERGLEPFKIAYDDFGDEPWLLVPQIGQLTALSPTGEVRARLSVPRRANYFILPTGGLLSLESDFQIFLDVPKLSLGDVNGDGQVDFIFSTRHEIRTFLRDAEGGYAQTPDATIPLRLVTPRDHIRGTGGVSSDFADIDGDGRLDLILTSQSGSLLDASTALRIFLNRDGSWHIDEPDFMSEADSLLMSNALNDMDGDGRPELVRLEFNFSVLEVVELLLSGELDVAIAIHRYQGEKGFGKKPSVRKKFSLPFSFETSRLTGFVPTAAVDINADGKRDFISSGDGEEIEIWIGDERGPFGKKAGSQSLPTAGVIDFRDLDGDGLLDFVIFDPHNFDVPVRVARNLGRLPGTRPVLRSAE